MRTAFVVSALAFVVPALSVPTIVPITKHAGPAQDDSYIVKFKDGVAPSAALAKIAEKLQASDSSITYSYAPLWSGFAATLTGDNLDFVRKMPEVEFIEQDSIMSITDQVDDATTDLDPYAVSQHRDALVGRGDNSGGDGSGVTVYGIDTGIYTEHSCFGGRAKPGISFVPGEPDTEDHNGHGTHTAGTAVGKDYGLATGAEIIAVKVLGRNGSGTSSGVMMGVKWTCDEFIKDRKPSIATMSLGGPAAGNANVPADDTSPANTANANTIGAADMRGGKPEKASFSNYGQYVDVWAPGVAITSAWIGGPDAKNMISGTSMATPGVASILAVLLSKCPKLNKPELLSDELRKHAVQQVTFNNATQAEATPNKGLAQLWECGN
ncbi:subtilisin-like serine protease [Ceratobasidium sp. 423]|nr:subtilisin-like serine protease [Ceratobasidium sp. 423]